MGGIRRAAVVLTLIVVAACSSGPHLPERVDPPASGEPQIGVAYGVVFPCAGDNPVKIGDIWWSFAPNQGRPPRMPNGVIALPYEAPGIVTLTSPTTATFRADADGSQWELIGSINEPQYGLCL